MRLQAIDLCSGPGGVTTGYKAAGINVLAGVDTDRHARASYAANHPEVTLYEEDLLALEPERLLDDLGLKKGELDILTACVPCQTFSSLGRKHRRKRDPRNRLVGRIADFAARIEPRAVVMENVPLLAKQLRFKRLLGRLRRLGYGVRYDIVDAADFGVPQRRRRLVLIALRGIEDNRVPRLQPEHSALVAFRQQRTVRNVLEGNEILKDDPLATPRKTYPPLVAKRIAAIPKDGGSRTSLPSYLQLDCHKNQRATAATNVYGRMKLDDVAPTLTTRCTTPACGRFLHPLEDRAITLREAALFQTFPRTYKFRGGRMSIQAQIGNAVPPTLAEAIALVLQTALV